MERVYVILLHAIVHDAEAKCSVGYDCPLGFKIGCNVVILSKKFRMENFQNTISLHGVEQLDVVKNSNQQCRGDVMQGCGRNFSVTEVALNGLGEAYFVIS